MAHNLYRRFPGRSDWQRNNDSRFRTLWRHCRALRHHAYHTLLLACLCAIALSGDCYSGILAVQFRALPQDPTPMFPLQWFPSAENPWGRQLNPKRQAPTGGFDACYFSLNAPTRPVAREHVPTASSRGVPEKTGIPPEKFAAYWVGRLHIGAARDYRPDCGYDNINMRILVDGHVIMQSKRSDNGFLRQFMKPVHLQPGDYLLEIELGGLPPQTVFELH